MMHLNELSNPNSPIAISLPKIHEEERNESDRAFGEKTNRKGRKTRLQCKRKIYIDLVSYVEQKK